MKAVQCFFIVCFVYLVQCQTLSNDHLDDEEWIDSLGVGGDLRYTERDVVLSVSVSHDNSKYNELLEDELIKFGHGTNDKFSDNMSSVTTTKHTQESKFKFLSPTITSKRIGLSVNLLQPTETTLVSASLNVWNGESEFSSVVTALTATSDLLHDLNKKIAVRKSKFIFDTRHGKSLPLTNRRKQKFISQNNNHATENTVDEINSVFEKDLERALFSTLLSFKKREVRSPQPASTYTIPRTVPRIGRDEKRTVDHSSGFTDLPVLPSFVLTEKSTEKLVSSSTGVDHDLTKLLPIKKRNVETFTSAPTRTILRTVPRIGRSEKRAASYLDVSTYLHATSTVTARTSTVELHSSLTNAYNSVLEMPTVNKRDVSTRASASTYTVPRNVPRIGRSERHIIHSDYTKVETSSLLGSIDSSNINMETIISSEKPSTVHTYLHLRVDRTKRSLNWTDLHRRPTEEDFPDFLPPAIDYYYPTITQTVPVSTMLIKPHYTVITTKFSTVTVTQTFTMTNDSTVNPSTKIHKFNIPIETCANKEFETSKIKRYLLPYTLESVKKGNIDWTHHVTKLKGRAKELPLLSFLHQILPLDWALATVYIGVPHQLSNRSSGKSFIDNYRNEYLSFATQSSQYGNNIAFHNPAQMLLSMIRTKKGVQFEYNLEDWNLSPSGYSLLQKAKLHLQSYLKHTLIATEHHLKNMMRVLIKLQKMYSLPPKQLMKGSFGGPKHILMSQKHVPSIYAEIAEVAYEDGDMASAFTWLLEAKRSGHDNQPYIDERLKRLITEHNELVQNAGLRRTFAHKLKMTSKSLVGRPYLYDFICSGYDLRSDKVLGQLTCGYTDLSHPYLILQPIKYERFSYSPSVVMYYDVLPLDDYALFKNLSMKDCCIEENCMHHNLPAVDQTYDPELTGSLFASVPKLKSMKKFSRVLEALTNGAVKIDDLTVEGVAAGFERSLPVTANTSLSDMVTASRSNIHGKRKHLSTWTFFLQPAVIGGLTAFPDSKFGVMPVAGAALEVQYFANEGKLARNSYQKPCPSLVGQQWVLRQKDNYFHGLNKSCPAFVEPIPGTTLRISKGNLKTMKSYIKWVYYKALEKCL